MLGNFVKDQIFETVTNLESSVKGQSEIDNAYEQFCNPVKHSMDTDLQKKL